MPGTTGSTGWVTRKHNDKLWVQNQNHHIISARIKFRGKAGVARHTDWNGAGGQHDATYTAPSPPTGVPCDAIEIRGSCTNNNPHSSSIGISLGSEWGYTYAQVGPGNSSFRTRYFSCGTTGRIRFTGYSGFSLWSGVRTRYIPTTVNPKATVNFVQVAHSGTLLPGEESSWYTLNLLSFQANEIVIVTDTVFNKASSEQVDVLVEYVYATKPVVVTNPAQNVEYSSATISGTINSTGHSTTTRFIRYRELGGEWIVADLGAGGVGSFSVNLTGLDPDQWYEFQAYATNTAGETYGITRSFKTEIAAPTPQTKPASNIDFLGFRMNGALTSTGGATTAAGFEWREPGGAWTSVQVSADQAETDYYYDLAGLNFESGYEYRAWSENTIGKTWGDVVSVTTLYPYLPAPTNRLPEPNLETENKRPVFSFVLPEQAINPATHYHARIRFSQSVDTELKFYEMETRINSTGWEAFTGGEWIQFPSGGVAPGTLVRVTPTADLTLGPVYWDAASWDGNRYGINSSARPVRILISSLEKSALFIDGDQWNALRLRVTEASNGEVGTIAFTVLNEPQTLNILTKNQSDFEDGTAEVLGIYDDDDQDIERVYDVAWRGFSCLQVTPMLTTPVVFPDGTFDQDHGGFYTDDLAPVDAEKSYLAFARVKGTGLAFITLEGYDAGSALVDSISSDYFVLTGDWDYLSVFQGSFDPSVTQARIKVEVYQPDGEGVPFLVDGLMLTESQFGEPVTWIEGGKTTFRANQIDYGSQVVLAIRDVRGNSEEFAGRVRQKNPVDDVVEIVAVLGDGFLGERIIDDNYPTDEDAVTITQFSTEEPNEVQRTESSTAHWDLNASISSISTSGGELKLNVDDGSEYYNLGTENVSWVLGYHDLESIGDPWPWPDNDFRVKRNNHLYAGSTKYDAEYPYDGGHRVKKSYWVTNTTVNLDQVAKLVCDWSVEINNTASDIFAEFGISTNKTNDNITGRQRASTLSQTEWEYDVSGVSGARYIKFGIQQPRLTSTTSRRIKARMFKMYGVDSNNKIIFTFDTTGNRVSLPLSLDSISAVDSSKINWTSTLPLNTTVSVQTIINTDNSTVPVSGWQNATSGSAITGATGNLAGKYLWVKQTLNANPAQTESPTISSLSVEIKEPGVFGVKCHSNDHGLQADDKIWIEGANRYNGIWDVSEIDSANVFVIPSDFTVDAGATGTFKLLGDIGPDIVRMIEDYCAPVSPDFVRTNTGFIAPIMSKNKTAIRVMEELRRVYGLYYFVDRFFRLHVFFRDDILDGPNVIRRGLD